MQKNPFNTLLTIIREEGSAILPPTLIIGEVTAPPPDLKIKFGDIELEKDEVLVADYLLAGHKRNFKVDKSADAGDGTKKNQLNFNTAEAESLAGSTDMGAGYAGFMHKHSITTDGGGQIEVKKMPIELKDATIELEDTLRVGDLVAMYPIENNSTFVVLARVVSL